MLIGYARVSTQNQNLDRQLGSLRAARCVTIFTDKATGKTIKGRPGLEKAIDALGTGDTLVVAEWDRATRSMIDGIAIMQRVAARGAFIKVLDKPHLDLTSKIGQGILAFLSALADDERERIVKRANDGRRAAKAKGVRMGRRPTLTDHQKAEAIDRLAKDETCRSIAKSFNCSHSTISRLKSESLPASTLDAPSEFALAINRLIKGRNTAPLQGKIAIAEAFDIGLQKGLPLATLDAFKQQLARAARDGLLELERCDTAGALPKKLLDRSRLKLGRDERHLIVTAEP